MSIPILCALGVLGGETAPALEQTTHNLAMTSALGVVADVSA